MPEDWRTSVAEVLAQIAAAGSGVFVVPEAHRAAVREGSEQAERGEFMTEEEVATLWNKCGLSC